MVLLSLASAAPLIRRCSIVGRHCALIASGPGPARGGAGRRAPVRVHDCTLGFSPAGGDGGGASESCEQQCSASGTPIIAG